LIASAGSKLSTLAVAATEAAPPALLLKSGQGTSSVSVIILIWRDDKRLVPLMQRLHSFPEVREVIISAAEPSPSLRDGAKTLGAIFIENATPNRGLQLNHGARVATAEWLLFHHADTELDRGHIRALAALQQMDVIGGAFYRKFDERHPRLRFLEKIERWHSRAFGTLYGDQSIFVRRKDFLRLAAMLQFL
jgi:GT2 family glycosyltransferase